MRILVFQHIEVEHPGVFREFWAESGHEWVVIELDAGEPIPSLDGFDLLVAMGGPMDVWQEDLHPWLIAEKAAIRHWVKDLRRPFLGICLGHQLLAEALGGKVSLMSRPEVGLVDVEMSPAGRRDPILTGFSPRIEIFQWHGAEVSEVPDGAEILVGNAACPVQAFRWGRHAYGFQYHCELTPTTVSDWERVPEYKASLEQALGAEEASRLASVVVPKLPIFRAAARQLNENLAAILASASVAAD